MVKVPARPSALTTEAGGASRTLRGLGPQLAEAEVVYVLTADADGMRYLPRVFGLDVFLDTVVDGSGVVLGVVVVIGVSVAAEN